MLAYQPGCASGQSRILSSIEMGTPGPVFLQKRLDFVVCFVILRAVVVDVGTIGLMQYSMGVLIGTPL